MARVRKASTNPDGTRGDEPTRNMRVRERNFKVRIRAGAGTNFEHINGMYLGRGEHEIDQISQGPGSTKGWGHLADGTGWVSLDFVDVLT